MTVKNRELKICTAQYFRCWGFPSVVHGLFHVGPQILTNITPYLFDNLKKKKTIYNSFFCCCVFLRTEELVLIFTKTVTQKMLVYGTVNYFKCSHNKTVNIQWGELKTSGILMPHEDCNFINK